MILNPLILLGLPITLNDFYEIEMGEQSDTISESDISIAPEVELDDLDDSNDISQELCDEATKSTILDFDNDIILTPSKMTFFLNIASLNLLSLRLLPLIIFL